MLSGDDVTHKDNAVVRLCNAIAVDGIVLEKVHFFERDGLIARQHPALHHRRMQCRFPVGIVMCPKYTT